jgi:hypothetical protein
LCVTLSPLSKWIGRSRIYEPLFDLWCGTHG